MLQFHKESSNVDYLGQGVYDHRNKSSILIEMNAREEINTELAQNS